MHLEDMAAHGVVESSPIRSPSASGLAAGHAVRTPVSAYPTSVGILSLTGTSTSSSASNASYSCASADTPSDCLSLASLSCAWCCGSAYNGPSACVNASAALDSPSSTCQLLITNATEIENRIRAVDAFVHGVSIVLIVYAVLHVAALCLLVATCVFRRRRRARASQIDPYHYWKEKDMLWEPDSALSTSSRLVFSPRKDDFEASNYLVNVFILVVSFASLALVLFARSPSKEITCYLQTEFSKTFWILLVALIFVCLIGGMLSYRLLDSFGMDSIDAIMSEPEFLEYTRKLTSINLGPNGLLPTLGVEIECRKKHSEQNKAYFLNPSFPIRKTSSNPFKLHHMTTPFPYAYITDASTIPNSLAVSSSAGAGFSPFLLVEIVLDIAFIDARSRDAFRGLLEKSNVDHATCPRANRFLKPVLNINVPYRRVAVWRTSTKPRLILSKAFRAVISVSQLGFVVYALLSVATWSGTFSLVKLYLRSPSRLSPEPAPAPPREQAPPPEPARPAKLRPPASRHRRHAGVSAAILVFAIAVGALVIVR
ncbi:hypothetical protein HK405_005861, partial [Cladochytrium tenue]